MSKGVKQMLDRIEPEPAAEKEGGGVLAMLSKIRDFGGVVWDGAKPAFDHGRSEAAAALFSPHGSAFIMYGGDGGQKNGVEAADQGVPAVDAAKQPEAAKDQGVEL